jgi:hypothetical protein
MPLPQLTDAQKASRKIKRDQKIERTKHLHDAVSEYLDAQKMKIQALSQAHHITPKQINDIISNQMHYRTSHKSQLIHALVHTKAKEMNAGKSNDFSTQWYHKAYLASTRLTHRLLILNGQTLQDGYY